MLTDHNREASGVFESLYFLGIGVSKPILYDEVGGLTAMRGSCFVQPTSLSHIQNSVLHIIPPMFAFATDHL